MEKSDKVRRHCEQEGKPAQALLAGEVELGGDGGGQDGEVLRGFGRQGENPQMHRPHLEICTMSVQLLNRTVGKGYLPS